jgi:hypothetical protein
MAKPSETIVNDREDRPGYLVGERRGSGCPCFVASEHSQTIDRTTNCRPSGRQFVHFGGWQTSQKLAATFNKGLSYTPPAEFMNTLSWGAHETLSSGTRRG